MENGIHLRINADSIYRTSVVTVSMLCDSIFEITNQSESAKILFIRKGNILANTNNTIEAVKDSTGKFEMEFLIIGLFYETEFKRKNKHLSYDCTYGTFLYPFISSQLIWKFESHRNTISNIILELPDSYRLLFYKSRINSNDGYGFSLPQQSFDLPNTLHVFTREGSHKNNKQDKICINIPIRLGGKDLQKLVSSPIRFSYLTLCSVFLCSVYLKDNIVSVIASVLALWSFLFERYNNSNVPQGQTLIKKLYSLLTINAFLASIVICVFHTIKVKLLCLLLFSFVIYLIQISLSYFNKNNSLPRVVEQLFELIINIEDKYNKTVKTKNNKKRKYNN